MGLKPPRITGAEGSIEVYIEGAELPAIGTITFTENGSFTIEVTAEEMPLYSADGRYYQSLPDGVRIRDMMLEGIPVSVNIASRPAVRK